MENSILVAIVVTALIEVYLALQLFRKKYEAKEDDVPELHERFIADGVTLSEALLQSRHAPMEETLQLNDAFTQWEKRVHQYAKKAIKQEQGKDE